MPQLSQSKYKEVALTLEGQCLIIQGITKYTTCSDVIKMVLKKFTARKERGDGDSFGIFESSRGTEKLIPGQNKLLKVMRSWGPANAREFVMKRISTMTKPIVSEAKRRKLTQTSSIDSKCGLYTNTLNDECEHAVVSGNINHTRVLQREEMKTDTFVKGTYSFGCEEMYRCTDSHRAAAPCDCCINDRQQDLYRSTLPAARNITGQSQSSSNWLDSRMVVSHTEEVKYALRKSLKTRKTVNTTSFECRSSPLSMRSEKQDTLQSTPLGSRTCNTPIRATVDKHELAQNIKVQIDNMDQREGKEAILNRYFADYIMFQSPITSLMCRGRGDGAESNDGFRRGDGSSYRRGDGSSYNCGDGSSYRRGDGSSYNCGDGSSYRRGDGSSYSCNNSKLLNNLTYDTPYFSQKVDYPTNDSLNHVLNVTPNTNYTSALGDVNTDVSSDSGQDDDDFDVAFIDEDVETTCVMKLVDYSLTESDLSCIPSDGQDDTSNMSSVSDYVRSIFNDNVMGDEDDELDSFMITKLADDISDEGLGSIESGDEL